MSSITQKTQILSKNGDVLSPTAVQQLKDAVNCRVVIKGEASDEVYRTAIDRFNKAFVSEAGIVVFCKTEEDIAACLAYVQEYDLLMTICCGTHSYIGVSSIVGGLVIDLREMKKVSINQENMTVTAQGGCQAIDLEEPLQKLGLSVVMGAVNDTGIGGLTLGGGTGFLTGQYGMVIDNLVGAKVVLANGSVVSTSETENPDLFWGLRGGGSNFGVVSEFTFRAHKQCDVFFGPMVFTPDKLRPMLQLGALLRTIVESPEAAGKLALLLVFVKGEGMPSVHPIALTFYDGPADAGKALLKPLYDLGPVADMMQMMPYANTTMVTPFTLGPPTHQHYATTYTPLFDFESVELLEAVMSDFDLFMQKFGTSVAPSKLFIEIRSHAKSCSIDPGATALRARVPALMMVLEAQHDASLPDLNKILRAEIKGIMSKLKKEMIAKYPDMGKFFNANVSDGTEKTEDMFGENLGRLRELKKKYDPGFVFDRWYPIQPEN